MSSTKKTITCQTCYKSFTSIGSLKTHKRKIHNPDKYKCCYIYKIIDLSNGNFYIGSTAKDISERLKTHEYGYKSYLKGKMNFVSSYSILRNGKYCILPIHKFRCKDDIELRKIEDVYLLKHMSDILCVNKNRSCISNEERLLYKTINKDKLSAKSSCDCGGKFTFAQKSTHYKSKKHKKWMLNVI
jgi:hypothetical protein